MKPFAAACLAVAAAVALAADFYEDRLRAGEAELAAGRAAEAADDLRIAAFGLLERPPLLCEALANLALAQEKARLAGDAKATLERYAQTARRAPECREANLSAERRRELEALAKRVAPGVASAGTFEQAPKTAPPSPTAAPPAVAEVGPSPKPVPRTVEPAPTPAIAPAPPLRAATPRAAAPSAIAPAAALSAAVDGAELDRQPQIRTTTRPVYPPSAERARVGGVVLLRVLVSETGEPVRAEVVRGVGPDLDAAALEAVRHWRFEPGQKAGAPVAAWMNVAVPFEPGRS